MSEIDVVDAHRFSSEHRDQISASDVCGCFYCGSTFGPAEVDEWTDDDKTALCPRCGIDSVLGSASGLPVSDPRFLGAMRFRWFVSSSPLRPPSAGGD